MPGPPEIAYSVHETAPASAVSLVDEGLGSFNASAAPLHEVRPLSCFATVSDGSVVGGAVGRTWGRCCELRQLWVSPNHRRHGIGHALVERFEDAARLRGCLTFYLETFSFQAPRLYQSLGYVAELEIDGFAPGVVKYVMVRRESPPA